MRRFPDTGAERLIRIKAAVSNLWQDAEKLVDAWEDGMLTPEPSFS